MSQSQRRTDHFRKHQVFHPRPFVSRTASTDRQARGTAAGRPLCSASTSDPEVEVTLKKPGSDGSGAIEVVAR